MRLLVGFRQSFTTEVGVDLGGGQMLVPQQFLNFPEIGSAVEQMSGVGMSQSVRAGFGVESRLVDVTVEDLANRSIRDSITESVEQHSRRWFEWSPARRDFILVSKQCCQRMLPDRNDAFHASLSQGSDESRCIVDVFPVEGDQFTDTQASTVEDLENGEISQAPIGVSLRLIEQAHHFLNGEEMRQRTRYPRSTQLEKCTASLDATLSL